MLLILLSCHIHSFSGKHSIIDLQFLEIFYKHGKPDWARQAAQREVAFGMGSLRGEKTFQTRCQGENC